MNIPQCRTITLSVESLLKIDDTIQGNIYMFVGKTVPTKYICRSRKEIIKLLEKYWSSDNLLFTPTAMHISKGQLLTLNAFYISTSSKPIFCRDCTILHFPYRLTICNELVELTNSVRRQDPNNNTDTETGCLV